jgi:hypothetical protein
VASRLSSGSIPPKPTPELLVEAVNEGIVVAIKVDGQVIPLAGRVVKYNSLAVVVDGGAVRIDAASLFRATPVARTEKR